MFDVAKILTCTDDITRRDFEKGFIHLYFTTLQNEAPVEKLENVHLEKVDL